MSDRGTLALLGGLAPLAWIGLGYMVFNVSPDETANRVLFFGLLYVSLAATFGLVAYFLSFRLFASKLYKGNVSRSTQQGVLWASFALVALLLQTTRALTPMNGLILVAAFVLVEFIALGRR